MTVNRFINNIKGKTVTFCGIGGSNLPLIEKFISYGAKVSARDKRTLEQLGDTAKDLKNMGVELKLGENYMSDISEEIVFRTPGMKFYMPELNKARNNGSIVTSEMEVFFDLCPCKIIAVTGSDGKTTTTTIISEFLKAEGKTVHLGGNIGRPLLPIIEEIKEDDIAVVELSSFQLISMRKSPDIAVITNIAPNHLDIHKDMQEYVDSKKNIFLHQNAFGRTILNQNNDITREFKNETRGCTYMFSSKERLTNGAWLDNKSGTIYMTVNNKDIAIMNKTDIKIPGNHNVENYLSAISAVWGLVNIDTIKKIAKEFSGVEHRAEFVREVKGVKYYNDSIASSPTRTCCGTLSLYDKKIILIAGGYDKKIPFDDMGNIVVEKVKLLILMGATADKIYNAVVQASEYTEENPQIIRVENMEQAVKTAYENAVIGDIVSLSPACASFDLYPNFMARGNHFKELVNNL